MRIDSGRHFFQHLETIPGTTWPPGFKPWDPHQLPNSSSIYYPFLLSLTLYLFQLSHPGIKSFSFIYLPTLTLIPTSHTPQKIISSHFQAILGLFSGYLISVPGHIPGQAPGKVSVFSRSGYRPGMASFAPNPTFTPLKTTFRASYGVVSRCFLKFMDCFGLFPNWRGLLWRCFAFVVALTVD